MRPDICHLANPPPLSTPYLLPVLKQQLKVVPQDCQVLQDCSHNQISPSVYRFPGRFDIALASLQSKRWSLHKSPESCVRYSSPHQCDIRSAPLIRPIFISLGVMILLSCRLSSLHRGAVLYTVNHEILRASLVCEAHCSHAMVSAGVSGQ